MSDRRCIGCGKRFSFIATATVNHPTRCPLCEKAERKMQRGGEDKMQRRMDDKAASVRGP